MKSYKIILTIIIVILVIFTVTIMLKSKSEVIANKNIDFDFTNANSIEGFSVNQGNVLWKNGELVYKITGENSNITTYEINVSKGSRYSALLTVHNTVLVYFKNETDATQIKLSFITSSDNKYDNKKSKVFEIKANSDYQPYYFNLSDIKEAKDYLRGLKIEPIGTSSGTIYIKTISFEREFTISDYAGKISSCISDGNIVTIKGNVYDQYNGKKVTLYESPVANYTQSINGLTKLAEATIKGGSFTIEIPFMNDNVTRLSTLFIAAVGNTPVSTWFRIENYQDFTDNPYEFSLNKNEVTVTENRFRAKGDSYTNDNEAIQKAIDYVSNQGGGKVVIPGDKSNPYGRRYIVTNIRMKDNVELHIEEGAVLWQSSRKSDYTYDVVYGHDISIPGVNWTHAASCHNYPLIQGDSVSNIKVTGKGIIRSSDIGSENIDGVSGNSLLVNCKYKIHLIPIGFYKCNNVEIRDISLKRTNNYHINMRESNNIYVANIFMDEVNCVSGDGISATIGTKNIVIDRCFLYSNDDAVVICSSYNDPRGLVWWHANPKGDNCIDNLIVRHSNLYGGHGITFITWGTDNPDLSKQEIKNITVYDNVLDGGCSIGSWGDNPYYGGPFDNTETNDFSPVKGVRFYNNIYIKVTDISPVVGTDIISDCGIHSSTDFLYGDFERTNGEKGWITDLSNWQYDKVESKNELVVGTNVGTVKKSSVVKGETGYVGYLKSKGRLYQGLYMIEGEHTFNIDVYLTKKSSARLFVTDAITGELIAEKTITDFKKFKNVKLSFKCANKTNCYIGIELSEGTVYIDNCTVTSEKVVYPKHFLVDFDENDYDCFEYAQWNKATEDGNTYISLPSYMNGLFLIQPNYKYDDCEISFSVMINAIKSKVDANVGISLRRNNNGKEQYDIHYNTVTKTLNVRRFEGGNIKVIYSKTHVFNLEQWYRMKAILNGGQLDFYLDDVLITSFTDDNPLELGDVFICTYNNSISLDDIKFAKVGGDVDEDVRKNINIHDNSVEQKQSKNTVLKIIAGSAMIITLSLVAINLVSNPKTNKKIMKGSKKHEK